MSGFQPRIAVIDHGAGNLVSISQALESVGAAATVVDSPDDLETFDGVVLPGVGATRAVMEGIAAGGFTEPLRNLKQPLLGICVGMQVLFERSDEDDSACLGILGGTVRRLRNTPSLPHIGWNDLDITADSSLFIADSTPVVYFVHSFAPVPSDPSIVTATSQHGETFVAAVESGTVTGVQFHPERSGTVGLKILSAFATNCLRSVDAP